MSTASWVHSNRMGTAATCVGVERPCDGTLKRLIVKLATG
jgi:hypothetical protein